MYALSASHTRSLSLVLSLARARSRSLALGDSLSLSLSRSLARSLAYSFSHSPYLSSVSQILILSQQIREQNQVLSEQQQAIVRDLCARVWVYLTTRHASYYALHLNLHM